MCIVPIGHLMQFYEGFLAPAWGQPVSGQPDLVSELTKKFERIVAEHAEIVEKNKELKSAIDRREKERLLLAHPEFFTTEMQKLTLMMETYKATLEELEAQAGETLSQMEKM